MIIGHDYARRTLERELPPVTLLLGPESIGKTTLALHLAMKHCQMPHYCSQLNADRARQIVSSAPLRGAGTVVRVIELDKSTESAQNILLKVLEEPPPHCRFILVSSSNPLPTIMSRARVFRLGLLTDEQVAKVLETKGLANAHEAEMAAVRGRGQVRAAQEAIADREASRITSVVATAVRAAASANGPALEMALRNWTPEHTRVLARWAMEKARGRWVYFTEDFAPETSQDGALRMLYVLSTYDARTGPAVALEILKEIR